MGSYLHTVLAITGIADGVPPYSYQWKSNIDGEIGNSKEFNLSYFSDGIHSITLTVQDKEGSKAVDSIIVNTSGTINISRLQKLQLENSTLLIDYYPTFDDDADRINLTSSHEIKGIGIVSGLSLPNNEVDALIEIRLLNENGNIIWKKSDNGTIFILNDGKNTTFNVEPNETLKIPDKTEFYGRNFIELVAIPNSNKIDAFYLKRPIYITPFSVSNFSDPRYNTIYYDFSTEREVNGEGPVGIIASPIYEQLFAYNATYNSTTKSYDETIPVLLAHQQLIGLTELIKKYPNAEFEILPINTNPSVVESLVNKFLNEGKTPLIVGATPHNQIKYQSLILSKAYKSAYMSYAMASSINDEVVWNGQDRTVYVSDNFRSNELAKPLQEDNKYTKDLSKLNKIKEYPVVLLARKELPLLQIAPTLSTKEVIENGDLDRDYSIYRIGPLVPIEHTYYVGASASIPAFTLSLDFHSLSLNLGYNLKIPIIKKEIPITLSLIFSKYGATGDASFLIWNLVQVSLDDILNHEWSILGVSIKLGDYYPFNILNDINEEIKIFYSAVENFYKGGIVMLNFENYLEPSSIFTILKTTSNEIGTSQSTVYLSVEHIRDTYPGSVKNINLGISYIKTFSDLIELSSAVGPSISLDISGNPEIAYYTGAIEDINHVMINDDVYNIEQIPFTYKKLPEGDFQNYDEVSLKFFKEFLNTPVKTKIQYDIKHLGGDFRHQNWYDWTRNFHTISDTLLNDKGSTLGQLRTKIAIKISNLVDNIKIKTDWVSLALALYGGFTTYSEAMEVAEVSTQELFYLGDPLATGYDDPLSQEPLKVIPTQFDIQLTSEASTLDIFNSTFVFTNLTNVISPNITMKVTTASYGPSTGYPQIPMITLSIQSPENQTLDTINVTLQNGKSLKEITLPMTVINIGNEPMPGVIANISHWPLEEWNWGSKTVDNITYSVINLFPFQYNIENLNGTYYGSINISIKTKIEEPIYKIVRMEAYPNIISLGPGSQIKESLRIFNDYKAKENSSNIQVKAEIPEGIEIIDTDGTVGNSKGKTEVNWHIEELRNDPYNYSKFVHLTIGFPDEIPEIRGSLINITVNYQIDGVIEENKLSIPVILIPQNLVDIEVLDFNAPSALYVNDSYNISARILNNGTSTVAMVPVKLFLDGDKIKSEIIDRINPQETRDIYFNFTPKIQGKFNLTSAVVRSPSEVNINNNIIKKEIQVVGNIPLDTITNLSLDLAGTTWLNFTWLNPPDPEFNYTILYLNGAFLTNVPAPQNYFNITSLTPDTQYELGTQTADTSGNINTTWKNATARTLPLSDTTPPVINSVTLNNNTPNTNDAILVTVNATDNIGVKGVVANGASLTNQGGNIWNGTIIALAGTHSVNVSASDAASNTGWNNSTSYTATTPPIPDTTPPVIMNVSAVPANDSAVITWDTDEASDSLVKYGASPGTQLKDNSMVFSHTLTLSGLEPDTVYNYVVNSTDAAGNSNESVELTFRTLELSDTTAPVIGTVESYPIIAYAGAVINVSAIVSDNKGVTSVTLNNIAIENLGGDVWAGSFTVPASTAVGSYAVTLKALDAAGNSAQMQVNYSVVIKGGGVSISSSPKLHVHRHSTVNLI